MDRRTVVLACATVIALAGAGTTFALSRPPAHHTARAAKHSPTPSQTPRIEHIATTAAPSTAKHKVSGPDEPTERHVIHTTGSVAVTSGNVLHGTHAHGAVGTPTPTP